MEKGAIGVNLGRNIWQNDFPVAMIKALSAIIHDGAGVEEAQEVFFAGEIIQESALNAGCHLLQQ